MSLDAHIVVTARGVDALLDVSAGATLALLGPNGSGKSTVLAAIAGTLRMDGGHVTLDGTSLDAPGAAGRSSMAPRERRVALVTQREDLFPSLSVLDNVAFGIRARGARRAHSRERALEWLRDAGLDSHAQSRPSELSGGQARRVAVLRALASEPRALLLDEPFAGVDVEAAHQLRALVAHAARTMTVVIATHEVLDAHLLADAVAVLDGGRVAEAGEASAVLTRPRTDFAAALAGRILVRGTACDGALELADGARIPVRSSTAAPGAPALVALSALDVTVAASGQTGDLVDTVVRLEPRGDVVRVVGRRLGADVAPHIAASLQVGENVALWLPRSAVAYAP